MGTFNSWPNFNQWLQTAWGSGMEYWKNCSSHFGATNLVFGQNPPYYLDDFYATFPKFFGAPVTIAGCSVSASSNQITIPQSAALGLQIGQFVVTGGVLPLGTVITGVNGPTLTVNTTAGAAASGFSINVFETPPLPTFVVQLYLNLANASLVQARYEEQWYIAMGWFIAHYCTLWCQTDATDVALAYQTIMHGEAPQGAVPGITYTLSLQPPGGALSAFTINGVYQQPGIDYTLAGNQITTTSSTQTDDVLWVTWPVQSAVQTTVQPSAAQIAAQGLASGIQTSKSVGDVSASYAVLESIADWGQWNLTRYGQQLATMARVIGSGPMVIW